MLMLHAFKRSKRGDSIGPWILIFILIFVLFGTMIWENWGSLFGDLTQNADAGMQLTIHYVDGTSRTVKTGTSLFPLSILDDGKEVKSLHLETFVTVHMTGETTSWEITGAYLLCQMHTKTGVKIGTDLIQDALPPKTGTTWLDGEQKQMFIRDLGVDPIETRLVSASMPSGDYQLVFTTDFDQISMTFADGSTDTMDPLKYNIAWVFQYSTSGIDSLSIVITTTPYF